MSTLRTLCLVSLSMLCIATSGATAAEANVLLIGSTQSFDRTADGPALNSKATHKQVLDLLRKELNVAGNPSLVFEDVYRTKNLPTAFGQSGDMKDMEYRCHSLAQWYFWPEEREKRLASLQGKGSVKWDYVVLVGDPHLVENMPGIYAEGVKLIADSVRMGSAKPVLLLPWSDKKRAEVVCRVGKSADIPVLAISLAQQMDALCQGTYEAPSPFAMKYVDKRSITYNQTGSSSEAGIEASLKGALSRCGVSAKKVRPTKGGPKIDFNYGRGNTWFEKGKQYKVEPDLFDRSYGFPMQDHSKSATTTLLYGIDKRLLNGRQYEDGTDLGIAWDMIKQNEVPKDIRCVPIRLMWAKMHDAELDLKPLGDKWHMSRHLNEASGTFIYTLLSGRCPIGPEPKKDDAGARRNWLGQKIGYETAWRMSHLTARVPGFAVKPCGTSTVSPNSSTELTVSLYYQPQEEVVVTIVTDNAKAASVSPSTVTFTPENHATPQKVTLTGGNVTDGTEFRVNFVTQSKDAVFDRLHDAWSYKATAK